VPLTCAYATLRQSVANLTFHNVSFNFATTISKFDTFSLSYHIVHKRITKVTDFLSFCLSELVYSLFALSELVCTKNVFCPILLFPLLSHPKLLPLWSVTDREICGAYYTKSGFIYNVCVRKRINRVLYNVRLAHIINNTVLCFIYNVSIEIFIYNLITYNAIPVTTISPVL
jgi:hypothetical protein